MPSTYTHYRFGKEVMKYVNPIALCMIQGNIDLFRIGLHGPDILFYYDALRDNKINSIGYRMHNIAASEFFVRAKGIISCKEARSKYMAYALGYVCHFALDSECHSYIEYVINHSKLTHTEIETEFERELLLQDNLNPGDYNTASHIVCNQKNANIIAQFYDGVTGKDIEKALQGMVRYNQLLAEQNFLKKGLTKSILWLSGNYKEMQEYEETLDGYEIK